MAAAPTSPGVRREDVFLKPEVRLATGVPGIVGFAQAKANGKAKPNAPFALHRKNEFWDNFSCPADVYIADAVAAFFDNGGERCYVVGTEKLVEPGFEAAPAVLEAAIDALAPVADLDLLTVPDAMAPMGRGSMLRVQRHAVAHCAAQGDRLAILDTPRGASAADVLAQRDAILLGQAEPVSAALYYPWVKTMAERLVPPSSAVAGIFARTDARTGVHKAPANEEVIGVLDLESATIQDRLSPEGINCLRAFPGRGIRVWGARTISREPAWRYVNVRRLVLTLRRWVALNMVWAGFEPNGPRLWIRIERELRGHLTGLWRAGALSGDTPAAAFYVNCDSETNPSERRDGGEVVTEIGLAPNPPAEFVVVRLTQREGVADLLPR
jgi:uncharacterized protein